MVKKTGDLYDHWSLRLNLHVQIMTSENYKENGYGHDNDGFANHLILIICLVT